MLVTITINCPTDDIAYKIAEELMADRLIAAANRYPEIQSQYFWRGKIETASEIPLVVKTRKELFERICAKVSALHPYETPSITAAEIVASNPDYETWIRDEACAS